MVNKNIEKNKLRKASADALNGIQLSTGIQHLPEKIESDILECIRLYFANNNVHNILCVDCTKHCQHPKGIHVIVEMENMIERESLENMAVLIRSTCHRKHFASVPEILFLQEHPLFHKTDCIPSRFMIRDEIKKSALNDKIYHVSVDKDDMDIPPEDVIEPNF